MSADRVEAGSRSPRSCRVDGRPDRRLGRPVQVPQHDALAQQPLGQLRRQPLAPTQHGEAGRRRPAGLQQQPPGDRGGLHDPRPGAGQQRRQPAGVGGLGLPGRSPPGRRWSAAGTAPGRRCRRRPWSRPAAPRSSGQAGAFAHRLDEVGQGAVGDHHALGSPGRAGGVDDVRGRVRAWRRLPVDRSAVHRHVVEVDPRRACEAPGTPAASAVTSTRAPAVARGCSCSRSAGCSGSSGTYAAPHNCTPISAGTRSTPRGNGHRDQIARLDADPAAGDRPSRRPAREQLRVGQPVTGRLDRHRLRRQPRLGQDPLRHGDRRCVHAVPFACASAWLPLPSRRGSTPPRRAVFRSGEASRPAWRAAAARTRRAAGRPAANGRRAARRCPAR